MAVFVAADVTRGQTTLDSACLPRSETTAQTASSRFVCIPYSETPDSFGNASAVHWTPATPGDGHEPHNTRRTYPILVKERVYDLGWRENWRRVMAQPLFDHGMPCQG
jgi:palmitoyltransferase